MCFSEREKNIGFFAEGFFLQGNFSMQNEIKIFSVFQKIENFCFSAESEKSVCNRKVYQGFLV